jgi:hypothetical protein
MDCVPLDIADASNRGGMRECAVRDAIGFMKERKLLFEEDDRYLSLTILEAEI